MSFILQPMGLEVFSVLFSVQWQPLLLLCTMLAFLELVIHLVCGEIVGNGKLPVIKKEFFVWDYFSYLTFDLNCLVLKLKYFEISFRELINSSLLHIITFACSFHFFEKIMMKLILRNVWKLSSKISKLMRNLIPKAHLDLNLWTLFLKEQVPLINQFKRQKKKFEIQHLSRSDEWSINKWFPILRF